MTIVAAALLAGIPPQLRDPLIASFNEIARNFREGRWEPAELNGGKLCEIVYTILRGHVDGSYPSSPSKPKNMLSACQALEQEVAFSRSVRIQIPRMLISLYEIRNNRGVGHAGGDVDPNHMDAVVVLSMSRWVMSELIRVFHGVTTDEASAAVDSLIEKVIPVVWLVDGKRRVLDNKLPMRDKALIILYSSTAAMGIQELFLSVEHANLSNFRRDVLDRLHEERLIEFNRESRTAQISPKGIDYVEKKLPLDMKS